MKKITVSILTTLLMLSMVFSSSVFAANEETSAWDSFLGLFSAKTAATSDVGVEYRGHVQNKGDFPLDGSWIQGPDQLGTVGESLRLEAFWIKLTNEVPAGLHIQYRVHVQNKGWMAPVEDGALAGTQGEGLQIESVEIKLVDDAGNPAVGYSVEYRGHIQNKGDMPADGSWYKDGEQLGTVGEFLRLEALEVQIVQTKANMTAYNEAVAAAGALTEADYTADSWAALETALATVVTEDNTQAEVDAATAAINAAIDALVMITKIDTVTATGVKTLTVNFNQAVTAEQQATATVTAKKGSVTTNLDKTAFATDGKSVVLTTSSKLTKGTYTVTAVVDGVTSTGTVDVVDEKVATIALTSDKAVQDGTTKSEAKVFYEVKNQYGEAMTGQTITWSISTGVAAKNDNNKSEFVITNAGTPAADFIPGTTVYITGVHAASGTVMNASVTVGLPAKADSVEFAGVYNTATKKIEALPAGFASGKYVLLYEAYDQYGHKLVPGAGQIVYTVDNPLFINSTLNAATPVLLNGVTYQALALVPGTNPDLGGTANINAISTVTGTNSSYTITADSLSMVKTFTMSAPSDLVVAGEKSEIPFEAYDQNGVAVTKYDQLKNKVTFNSPQSPAATTLAFEKNADGTAKLVFEPQAGYVTGTNTSAIASITSVVVNQGSFSALNLDVKAAAVPTVIIGLDPEVSTTVAKGQDFKLYVEDLIIQDQYGRVMTDAKVTTANPIVSFKTTDMSGTQVANPSGTAVAFKATGTKTAIAVANASGTQTVSSLEFAIYKTSISNANVVAGSQKSFPVTVATQSDYASYEIADPGMLYMNTTTPGSEAGTPKDITIYGVKADGTKVVLPQDNFVVRSVSTEKGIKSTAPGTKWTIEADNYVAGDFLDTQGAPKNVTAKITVDVKDAVATGTIKATITKDVTVSNAAPTGTTITMKDKGFGGKYNITVGTTAENTLAGIAITEVKSQYGVVMTNPTVTISNVTMATDSAFASGSGNITGAVVGDAFTANFTYGTTVYTADFLVNDTDTNNTAQKDTNAVAAAIAALADDSVTITDPAAQPAVTLNVPTTVNGVTFTFTAKTDNNATVAIAGDKLTAAVTRNASAGTPTITVTATRGSATATQVYDISVPAGATATDAVTIAKQ